MMFRTSEQISNAFLGEKGVRVTTTFSHLSETSDPNEYGSDVSARISTVPEPSVRRRIGRLPGFIGLVPPPALDKSAFVFGSCRDLMHIIQTRRNKVKRPSGSASLLRPAGRL